ncbi:hypothetical protein BDW66DRAFT_152306 [Aspergillus desertorum]
MTATLTSLPLETLSLICEYIAVSHKPSIYAFSESTRSCHTASNNCRFRRVRIRVKTRRGLDRNIREWNKILARNSGFGCVQHFTIEGRLALFWENGTGATSLPAKLLDNLLTEYRHEDEFTRRGTFYDHIIRGPLYHIGVQEDQNGDAWASMARGLAPDLKQVHVVDSGPGFKYRPTNRDLSKQALTSRKQVSQDLRKKNFALGQLKGLSLDPANLTRFDLWKKTVDFSHLRSLQLWRVQMGVLKTAATWDFSSLKTLALGLFPRRRNPSQAHLSDHAAGAFIASLPPLESIHLTGPSSTTLSVPDETSRIPPIDQLLITSTEVRKIQQYCPNVQDLRLQVERTLVDQKEQDIYRALGQLPRLRHLSLQLDVWDAVGLGDMNEATLAQSCYAQHIFINVVLDAESAREILNLIASNSPIMTLELMPGIKYVWGDLVDILEVMRRHWRCSKVLTGPGDGKVVVEELWRKSRKRRVELNDHVELGVYGSASRKLWPSTAGDLRKWKDEWHSFPLRRNSDRVFQ